MAELEVFGVTQALRQVPDWAPRGVGRGKDLCDRGQKPGHGKRVANLFSNAHRDDAVEKGTGA